MNNPEPLGMVTDRDEEEHTSSEEEPVTEATVSNGQQQDQAEQAGVAVDVLAAKVGDLTDWMGKFYALVDDRVGDLPHIRAAVNELASSNGHDDSDLARRLDDLIEAVAETATGIDARLTEAANRNPSENPSLDLSDLHAAVAELRTVSQSLTGIDSNDLAELRQELITHLEGLAHTPVDTGDPDESAALSAIRSDVEQILTTRLGPLPQTVAAAVNTELASRLDVLAEVMDGVAALLERADGSTLPDELGERLDQIAASADAAGNVQSSVDDLAVAVGEAITGIHDRLSRLDALDGRLTAVLDAGDDPQTTELFEHVADMRGRLDEMAVGLSRSVNEISSKLSEEPAAAAATESDAPAGAVDELVIAVGEAVANIEGRLDAASDDRAELASLGRTINSNVDQFGHDLTNAVVKVESSIAALADAARNRPESTGVEEAIAPLTGQVAEVLAAIKNDPTGDTVNELVVAVGESLEGIHSRLSALPSNESISVLLADVTERLNGLPTTEDHASLTAELRERLGGLPTHKNLDGIAALLSDVSDRLALLPTADDLSAIADRLPDHVPDENQDAFRTELVERVEALLSPAINDSVRSDIRDLHGVVTRGLNELTEASRTENAAADRTAAAIDRMATEIATLRDSTPPRPDASQTEQILASVREIAERVDGLVANPNAQLPAQLQEALAAVDGVAAVDRQVTDVTNSLARIETLVERIDVAEVAEAVSPALDRVATVIGEAARRSDVSTLASRVEELLSTTGTGSERVAAVEATINEHLRSYFALTEAVGDRLDELTEAVAGVGAPTLDLSPVVERLDGLRSLTEPVTEVPRRLEAIERSLDRLHAPERTDSVSRGDIDHLGDRVAEIAALLSTPASDTSLHQRVDAVSDQVSELAAVLAEAVGAIQQTQRDSETPQWVEHLESSFADVGRRLDRVANDAEVRAAQIATIGEAVNELVQAKSDPATASNRLDALSVQLDELIEREGTSLDVPLVIADIKAVVERTASKVGAVDTRLASFDLPELREHLETRFASVEARIDARQKDSAALIEEVNAAVVAAREQIDAVMEGQTSAAATASAHTDTLGSVRNVVMDIQRALTACRAEWSDAHTLLSTKLDTAATVAADDLARTDAVAERVDELARTTQQRLDGWVATVQGLESTMLAVTESLTGPDAIKEHLDEQRVALGGVASELRQVRNQFTPEALTASFADDVRAVIGDASEQIAALVDTLDARSGDVAALAARVEDRIGEMEQRVGAAVAEVTEAVAGWGEQVSGEVQQSVSALDAVTRHAEEVRDLRDQVSLSLDGVNAIAASLGEMAEKSDTKVIRTEVTNVARTLAALSRSVGSLDQTLVEVRTEIAAGQAIPTTAETSALEDRVADLAEAVEAGLGEVSRQMGTLSHSLPSGTTEADRKGNGRVVRARRAGERTRPLRASD